MTYYRNTVSEEDVRCGLPVFVFGTLRPGCGNDRRWHDIAVSACNGTAVLRDHRLVTNGSFPYCLPAEGEQTVGCLIVPRVGQTRAALESMDALEGVPVHYNRKRCTVEVPGAIVQAWYYVPDDWESYSDLPAVPKNDWSHREQRHNPWLTRQAHG